MIFKINNSDFSKSNIGALNAYKVTTDLRYVTSDSTSTVVSKDSLYTATFTIGDGFEFANAVVTMGSTDVTSNLVWDSDKKVGVLTINQVKDDIHISISAFKVTYEWYIDGMADAVVTNYNNGNYINGKTATSNTNPNSGAFAYANADGSLLNNCVNKPINILRLVVGQNGILTYGKIGANNAASTYQVLGTINLANANNSATQEYMIDAVILSEGERLWFHVKGDTGRFRYTMRDTGQLSHCSGIASGVGPSKTDGFIANYLLGIDIGYRRVEQ